MSKNSISYTAEEFNRLIENIVEKKFSTLIKSSGLETTYNCKIVEVSEPEGNTDPYSQTASVTYTGNDDTVVYDLKNLSGQLLKAGDKAIVYAIKDSLSNAYIGRKYN